VSGERVVLAGDASGNAAAQVVEEPEQAVRWMIDGGPETAAVTADDLRDAIGPLTERLRT
jgi:hypothetical protein